MNSRKPPLFSTAASFREMLYLFVEQPWKEKKDRIPVEVQAKACGVGPSYLYNASNTNRDEDGPHYQGRLLVPHMRVNDDVMPAQWLAHQVNHFILPYPSTGKGLPPANAANFSRYVCHLMKEVGDVAKVSAQRLGDGTLDDDDRARLQKEVQDIMQKAAQILEALKGEG